MRHNKENQAETVRGVKVSCGNFNCPLFNLTNTKKQQANKKKNKILIHLIDREIVAIIINIITTSQGDNNDNGY